MGKLIYFAMTSLDGYVNDTDGNFEWAAPDEEVHAFVNDLARPVEVHLYGRRMYEVMSAWDTWETTEEPEVVQDFAHIWKSAEKVVYSSTLPAVTTAKTRLERRFDPAAVREMKARDTRKMSIAGPTLAAHALFAGLVDELQLVTVPYAAGGGTNWLPAGLKMRLELLEERRFAGGAVFSRYALSGSEVGSGPRA